MEYRCATSPPPARHLQVHAHYLQTLTLSLSLSLTLTRYMPTISKLIADADAGVAGDLRMLTIREHRFPFLRKVGHLEP